MCGVKLNERKKSEELRELLGLDQKSRLRWFGHVERKDDNDWVKGCITWEVEGIRQRGRPKKTWWDYSPFNTGPAYSCVVPRTLYTKIIRVLRLRSHEKSHDLHRLAYDGVWLCTL